MLFKTTFHAGEIHTTGTNSLSLRDPYLASTGLARYPTARIAVVFHPACHWALRPGERRVHEPLGLEKNSSAKKVI